jgi:hypothetical protein
MEPEAVLAAGAWGAAAGGDAVLPPQAAVTSAARQTINTPKITLFFISFLLDRYGL